MRILLIDYYGICDRDGKVMGHTVKALYEYSSMLQCHGITIDAALSPCIEAAVSADNKFAGRFGKIIKLPEDIRETEGYGIRKRILDKFRLFRNLRHVYNVCTEYDAVWFYRTDFFLFLYMMLHRKPQGCRLAVLVYQQVFTGGKFERILQAVYRRALKKTDIVICSNANHVDGMRNTMQTLHPAADVFYMPDYTYDPEQYKPFLAPDLKKEDKTVCVGTMNPYKQLEEMVKAYRMNGKKLETAGRFFDHARAVKLTEMLDEGDKYRIHIRDCNLSETEYMRLLGTAKFAILPYDMSQYQSRTSGVLQECIFLRTIPIAPRQLLEENRLPGAAYDDIKELEAPGFFDKIDCSSILAQMDEIRDTVDRKRVAEK
ncbi:MAG: hypothetical protein IJ239_08125, partial [Eubacterium sp.]|nr:hypothetical protein [Eubacterium sp.]